MKKTTILLTLCLFVFGAIAQEKINWLTTSQFEKAVKKGDKNSFVLVEGDIMNERIAKDRIEEIKKRLFAFLEDEALVNYLNENFVCYRFNVSSSESVEFQGKEYLKTEQRGRASHEFASFLVDNNQERYPAIVLRDKEFNLFEFQRAVPDIEEIKVILEAEKLKVKYIKEQLGEDSKYFKESASMIRSKEKRLERAQENIKTKSVFTGRQTADRLLKKLTYFTSSSHEKMDLKKYMSDK